MKLFDMFKQNKKVELDETPVSERQKTNNSSTVIPLNKDKIKDFIIKAVGGVFNQYDTRERFQRPEYNL